MTALANNRGRTQSVWKRKSFTLASGQVAFQGGPACMNPATGKVVATAPSAGGALVFIGFFNEKVDATAADKDVEIDLVEEVFLEWIPNATAGDACAATDVMKMGYFLDDNAISPIATSAAGVNRPRAGRIWAVDATKGVAVQKLPGTDAAPLAKTLGATAFAANDSVLTDVEHGAVYDIPATGAASTVTLPAAAKDGTVAYFVADGTKNAHTVQYRDATGATNLTTALTAAKRHLVTVTKRDGKWFANAYVSP